MKYLIFIILLSFILAQDVVTQQNITDQHKVQNTTLNNQTVTTNTSNTSSHTSNQTTSNQENKTNIVNNQPQVKQQIIHQQAPEVVVTNTSSKQTKDASTESIHTTNASQTNINKEQVKAETISNDTLVNATIAHNTETNTNNNKTNTNNNGTSQQQQVKSQSTQQQQHVQQKSNPQVQQQVQNILKNQSNIKEQIKNNAQTNIKQNQNNVTIELNHDDVVNVTTNATNNTSHNIQAKEQAHQIQIIQLSHNGQAILPEVTPHFTQTIEGQVDGHAVNYERTQNDRMIENQLSKTKQNARIDYQHMKDYAFVIKNIQVFYIKPDHDTDFMCQFNMYWEQDNSFVESSYQKGQQVKVVVSENGMLIHSDEFYRSHGFTIRAKKGKMYALRLINKGYNKLITMLSSNYVSQNQMSGKINADIANEHELQIQKMKNTLRTFLGVAEKSMMINQQIAYNVTLHTKRYMSYQIIEMLLVIFGAVVQIYLVKRLLNPHSII